MPSQHPGMGAVLHDDGCTFRVWAPNASAVSVKIDSKNWNEIPLTRDGVWEAASYWSEFVSGVSTGNEYKFNVTNCDYGEGNHGGTHCVPDPYGRMARENGYGTMNSVVMDPSFDWAAFQMPRWNELVIYEMHVGSFNWQAYKQPGTFYTAMEKLPYLRDLGVNAIQLLPIAEYPGHRGMGYNPSLYYAPEDTFGPAHDLKLFINEAHKHGIAVILDLVFNHAGPNSELWQFDGWHKEGSDGRPEFGGIFLYADERADTHGWGERERPDYGRPEVQRYLRDNALFWLHEYRVDGLRWDATAYIRNVWGNNDDPANDIGDGWRLMQTTNEKINVDQPWKISIAEDLKDNAWIAKPANEGGAGFDSQWDDGLYYALRNAVVPAEDSQRDMGALAYAMCHRVNAPMTSHVMYIQNHDKVRPDMHNANRARLAEEIHPGKADSWESRKRSILAAGIVLTVPSIPMLFQGEEFLAWGYWTDDEPLNWNKVDRFFGIMDAHRRLIRLRRNWENNTRGLSGEHIHLYHVNEEAKVIAYHRWDQGGPGDDVIVVANFSAKSYDSYNVGFARSGAWYLRFDSDWSGYSGDFSNRGYGTTAHENPNQGMPCNGNVGLGPYSLVILSQ